MNRRPLLIGLVATLVVFGGVAPLPVAAAEMTIDSVDIPSSVTADESFDITVDVSGSDINGDEIDVTLGLPDQIACSPSGSQTVSLSDGSGTATFSCDPATPGDYNGEIDVVASATTSGGDSISDSTQDGLTVSTPASFSLTTSLDASSISEGGSTTLTASVSNTGDDATSYDLSTMTDSGLLSTVASGSASGTVDGGDTVFVTYTVDGDSSGDHDATVTLTGGNGQVINATETVSVESTGDDDDGSGGSGGSGGGLSLPTEEESETNETTNRTAEDATNRTSVADVRQELESLEPTTRTSTEIVDADPDRPGVNVNPEGTDSVREITFDDAAHGRVDISEYQDPPASVSESVTDAVSDASQTDSDGSTETTASVATVADIEPDSEEVKESSATVTMTVDSADLDDPDDAVIVHERDDSWEILETTVDETNDGEITFEAHTESFSLFAVAEVDEESTQNDTEPTDATETEAESTDEESSKETDDGTPGFGFTLAVVALIATAMLARRRVD